MRLLLLFFTTLLLTSCRLVPIQIARVMQIESYEQTYDLENVEETAKLLEKLVGEKNWGILIDYLGSNEYLQELQQRQIVVKGNLIMSITLNPSNHETFFAEGFGRYYVIRKTTKELLFSADFHILENQHTLNEFTTKGFIATDIQQYMIRHFPTAGEKNYFHEKPFRMNIAVTSSMDGVYSIDYEKPHELVIDGQVAGHLHFSKSFSGKKLIDLRSRGYVKNDYK